MVSNVNADSHVRGKALVRAFTGGVTGYIGKVVIFISQCHQDYCVLTDFKKSNLTLT